MVKVNARQCLIDYSYMNNNSSTMCLLKQDNRIEITNLNQVCMFSLYINWDVSHSECKRMRLTKTKKNTVEGLHSPQSRLLNLKLGEFPFLMFLNRNTPCLGEFIV